jgi:hypothetical protein
MPRRLPIFAQSPPARRDLRPAGDGCLSVEVGEPQLDLSPGVRAASQRRRLAKVTVVQRVPAEARLAWDVLRTDFEQCQACRTFDGRQLGLLAHLD